MTAPAPEDLYLPDGRRRGLTLGQLDNLFELKTPEDEIQWRSGQKAHAGECDRPCRQPHKQLAYVDARYVMRVLDSVLVGPGNWQRDHRIGPGGITLGGIGLLVEGEWLWKWDGAGETDIEGEKGAVSDSFKRAAVSWGIARDLYAVKPRTEQPVAAPARQAPVAQPAAPRPREDDMVAGIDEEQGEASRCPIHHTPWKLVPGGVSKNTGRAYDAFWSCTERGCESGNRGTEANKAKMRWSAMQEAE